MIPNENPTRALVITHGAIAEELKNVVEMILGPTEGLEAMSNSGKSAPDITQAVVQWLDQLPAGPEGDPHPGNQAIILIDDYGGSCATAAQLAVQNRPKVAIISGVNLAMLLGFVTWRESSDFEELVRKVVQKGREAITLLGGALMPLVLARIDDRLIHGQVTVGWATHLKPDRILLANNEIAADEWQCEVYSSSVPPGIQVSILSLAEAASDLKKNEKSAEKTILLTASLAEMAALSSMGVNFSKVNLGGLHFGPGKKEMLPFVYLGRQDFSPLRHLLERNIPLFAQQVPGGLENEVNDADIDAMEDLFA